MAAAEKLVYTEVEYLIFEEQSEEKHEYIDGYIVDMAGGTFNHSQVSANVIFSLINASRGKNCMVFSGDLKVKVEKTGSFFYPDSMVVCGIPELVKGRKDAITTPLVIIEVLSDSTANYDCGKKFAHYRQLESLQGYILISQDTIHVDAFHKAEEGSWVLTDTLSLEKDIYIPALDIYLPTKEVYDKVTVAPSIP